MLSLHFTPPPLPTCVGSYGAKEVRKFLHSLDWWLSFSQLHLCSSGHSWAFLLLIGSCHAFLTSGLSLLLLVLSAWHISPLILPVLLGASHFMQTRKMKALALLYPRSNPQICAFKHYTHPDCTVPGRDVGHRVENSSNSKNMPIVLSIWPSSIFFIKKPPCLNEVEMKESDLTWPSWYEVNGILCHRPAFLSFHTASFLRSSLLLMPGVYLLSPRVLSQSRLQPFQTHPSFCVSEAWSTPFETVGLAETEALHFG